MPKEFCYFYSRYNMPDEEEILCTYDKKYKARIVCEKCPYFISENEADQKIRKFIIERTLEK